MIEAISASWCVWSPGVFHITGTTTHQLNSQIKTPTNPTYEPIVDPSRSATTTTMASFSSLSLSFAFYLPLLELDLLVFLLLGLLVGFCRCRARAIAIELKQRSHRPRRPGTNKMETICGWRNKEVWVSAGLFGIGFWFLVAALCLWVFNKFVCEFFDFGSAHLVANSLGESSHTLHMSLGLYTHQLALIASIMFSPCGDISSIMFLGFEFSGFLFFDSSPSR